MAERVGARQVLRSIRHSLARELRERPYPVLALAVAAGCAAGGGLLSSFTQWLARAALGALVMPGLGERLRRIAGERRGGVAGAG